MIETPCETFSKLEKWERGIDTFEVGQLVTLSLPSMVDGNLYTSKEFSPKEIEQNVKEDIKKASKFSAIIMGKTGSSWPTYEVWFLSRSNSGEQSGWLALKDFCVWRYIERSDHEKIEGDTKPAQWLTDAIKLCEKEGEQYFDDILNKDIFYVIDIAGVAYKQYVV